MGMGFCGSYFNQTFLKSIILMNEEITYYVLIILIISLFLKSINFHPIKFYNSLVKIIKFFYKKEINPIQIKVN